MTGRSCWCLELFRSGQLTARNIDVVECSRLAPAVQVARGRVDRAACAATPACRSMPAIGRSAS